MYKPKQLVLRNFLSHRESIFHFKEGKAVLVVGQNLDKEGQKGNGAGKSSLNEGISVAISGQSIRDCKPRELIRRGSDEGEVEIILHNTIYGTNLRIWRKLYLSSSKSSECKIWEDDKEVLDCPDINSYNKFIWTMLGITKEDFFSFYLITKENYVPFLTVGDGKKKEIINRFSGANVVDKTDEIVKQESSTLQLQITDEEKKIIQSQSKQQLLQEQLVELQNEFSDEKIIEKKKGIEKEIEETENLKSLTTITITEQELVLVEIEKKLLSIKDEGEEKEVENFKLEIQKLSTQKDTNLLLSREVVEEFKVEIDEIKDTELTCNLEKKEISDKYEVERSRVEEVFKKSENEIRDSKVEKTKEKEELENKLAGAISCPKCSHEFTLRFNDFNVQEGEKRRDELVSLILEDDLKSKTLTENYKQQLKKLEDSYLEQKKELEDIINSLEEQKKEVNERIVQKREKYVKEIELLDKKIFEINQTINTINTKVENKNNEKSQLKSKIESQKLLISNNSSILQQYQQKIENLFFSIENLSKKDTVKEDSLRNQIIVESEKERVVKVELDSLIVKKQEVDEWLINFKNFKSHLANQSIKNISDYTNLFLQSLESNITINVEGYKMMSNKKLKEEITVSVYKNGLEEGSYGTFSAGERGRIDVCCILGLQELINLNTSSGGLDLLICDEVLDSIDELGMELLINSLQSLGKTIMIVSQNQINSLKENTIIIQKENKISTIIS